MPLHEGILIRIIFLLEFIIVVYCCMQYYFRGMYSEGRNIQFTLHLYKN